MNEIEIYTAQDGKTQMEVRFEGETAWLTQGQIVALFQSSKANISEHTKNIFEEGELIHDQTVRKFRTVRTEGKKQVSRLLEHYNLDLIISIGYRVNSKRGTQFRQWATQRLKDYLVKGHAINQKRLDELGKMIQLIENSGKIENLQLQEAKGLLEILGNYTKSFVLLSQFDSQSLKLGKLSENITYEIKYDEAILAISELKKQLIVKKEATNLFGFWRKTSIDLNTQGK